MPNERVPIKPIPPDKIGLVNDLQKVKADLEKSVAAFMVMLQNKKLDKNKSFKEIDQENRLFAKLVESAKAAEEKITNQGSFGLSITALRVAMFINNKMNEMMYEIDKIKEHLVDKNEGKNSGEGDDK